MSLPIIVRPEAEEDLRQAHEYLQASWPALAGRFLVEVREVLERIEAQPELYGRVWKDVRAARLKKLRYIVYYVFFADRVEVLAVLHGSRDPSIWRSRM